MDDRQGLIRFAWLSIATAIITIALKVTAFLLTSSVGLLSDALESSVNLVAAVIALIAVTVALRPPDEEHAYGHTKAEYFSGGIEGGLIILAAATIIISALERILHPQMLQRLDVGLLVSLLAAALNFVVALVLLRAGRAFDSAALVASARHLLADVWTTAGVLLAIGAVAVTDWAILDPLVAMLVGVQILNSGLRLVRNSVQGLMDTALPEAEQEKIVQILDQHAADGVEYHALRTRQSGAQRFVSVHIQVPGHWTVQRGHGLLEEIEADVRRVLPFVAVFTHLEPIEDPVSWDDISLIRGENGEGGSDQST